MIRKLKKLISVALIISLVVVNFDFYDNFLYADTIASSSEIEIDEEGIEISEYVEEPEENIQKVKEENIGQDEEQEKEQEKKTEEEEKDEIEEGIASDSEIEENTDGDNEKETEEESEDKITEENDSEEILATKSEMDMEELLAKVSNDEDIKIASDSDIKSISVASGSEVDSSPVLLDNSFGIGVDVASDSEADEGGGLGFRGVDIKVPRVKKGKLFAASRFDRKFDQRTKTNSSGAHIVPPVRNQGRYGTCWAFSTLGMMETSLRMKNIIASDNAGNLSESALAYFFYNLEPVYNNSVNVDSSMNPISWTLY